MSNKHLSDCFKHINLINMVVTIIYPLDNQIYILCAGLKPTQANSIAGKSIVSDLNLPKRINCRNERDTVKPFFTMRFNKSQRGGSHDF